MADHSRTRQGGWLRGKVGPSDLLLSQRVVQRKGISVLPIRNWLLVCAVCYCVCNFSSQEDFPINQKKKKKKKLEVLLTVIQYRYDFRDLKKTQFDMWEMSSPFKWN